MPPRKRKNSPAAAPITDYRHDTTRKNIPPAGLAAQGGVRDEPHTRYFYDPHLPAVLRFDETGESDNLPEIWRGACWDDILQQPQVTELVKKSFYGGSMSGWVYNINK